MVESLCSLLWVKNYQAFCHLKSLLYVPGAHITIIRFKCVCLLSAFFFLRKLHPDFPEKAMAPHSSTLAWKIPWTEEPGRLRSMGSLRVGHDWAHFHFSLSCIGEGNGNPLQCSCLENPRDRGAWWAAVYGVAQGRTRLEWLSSILISIVTTKGSHQ